MNEANLLCIRFDFGVPLEDIFPPNDIHPKLYNLFYETYFSFMDTDLFIEQIFSSQKVAVDAALNLKDVLVNKNFNDCCKINTASYFWLLRHFFGLLPLPLFPKFTDGQFYNWHYLAKQSRNIHLRSNHSLLSEISWWIYKLPKANILLIHTLMNFLRKIALKRISVKKLEARSVKLISIYFASSLFARPFTPGLVTSMDTLYYPLLAYIMIHWPKIKKKKEDCFYHIERQLSSIWEDNHLSHNFIRSQLIDCSCQTSSVLLTGKKHESIEEESLYLSFNEENNKSESKSGFIIKYATREIEDVGFETDASQTRQEKDLVDEENSENDKTTDFADEEKSKGSQIVLDYAYIQEKEDVSRKLSGLNISENDLIQEKSKNFCEETDTTEQRVSVEFQSESYIPKRRYSDSPVYETVSDDKLPVKSSSETAIFKKTSHKFATPKKLFRQKLLKINFSLAHVISNVNKKLKSKHEFFHPKSLGKLENVKYNLLEDRNITKVQSLHRDNFVNVSPNIKYEKLKTL